MAKKVIAPVTQVLRIDVLQRELQEQRESHEKQVRYLVNLIRMGREVVEDFMPNIGHCVLKDYRRLDNFVRESSVLLLAHGVANKEK